MRFTWFRNPLLLASVLFALAPLEKALAELGPHLVLQIKGEPVESASAKRGRMEFGQTCGFCHGVDATGGAEGPNLMRSSLVRHDESGSNIGQVIREGRPSKGMPPQHLSEAQISDVVEFLHWRLFEVDKRSPDDPRQHDLRILSTGDSKAGQAFFFGKGNCSHCHSPSGDLAGIGERLTPADLQARFLYPQDVSRTATVTTKSGKHFQGRLFAYDQFHIAIKDGDGWYHSWRCRDVQFQIADPLAEHLQLLHVYTEADLHNMFAYLETLK